MAVHDARRSPDGGRIHAHMALSVAFTLIGALGFSAGSLLTLPEGGAAARESAGDR